MPVRQNLLSENLEFVLRTFESCGTEVCDALLLFHRTEKSTVPLVYTNPHGFRSVDMPLEMIPGTNFVAVWTTPPEEC
jgi:hypothetical protein